MPYATEQHAWYQSPSTRVELNHISIISSITTDSCQAREPDVAHGVLRSGSLSAAGPLGDGFRKREFTVFDGNFVAKTLAFDWVRVPDIESWSRGSELLGELFFLFFFVFCFVFFVLFCSVLAGALHCDVEERARARDRAFGSTCFRACAGDGQQAARSSKRIQRSDAEIRLRCRPTCLSARTRRARPTSRR